MIKVSQGYLGDDEAVALRGVFDEGYYGHGAPTIAFEKALGAFLGGPEVVAVNTGTTALHLALEAIGAGPGDEVILPSLTFVGAFQAVLLTGATPVACDVDPATLSADVIDVAKRVTKKTKAVMPMHYAGTPCDMDGFLALKEKTGIRVIEDAAHAFGSASRGRLIGSFGDVTCFSFDSIKNITCGEGGAIVCADPKLAENLRVKRHLGIERKAGHAYEFDVKGRGFRYHMGALNAAVGMAQLKRFGLFAKRRREIRKTYVEAFRDVKGIGLISADDLATVPHIFVIRVKDGKRDRLMRDLSEKGIETRVNYVPNHFHALFKTKEKLPATESAYQEILTLPLHCRLSDKDVGRVIAAVKGFF